MQKYVASPNAEVIGSAMNNFFVSLNKDMFMPIVEQTLSEYGITEIKDDEWYPHQVSLHVFKRILDTDNNASENLVALGLAYVETAAFPPEIDTIATAMHALKQTYHLNIRNVPKTEGYEVIEVSPKHIQVVDENPFPHDTVYGFIWGVARRFREGNEAATVTRKYINELNPDDNGAIYDVTW